MILLNYIIKQVACFGEPIKHTTPPRRPTCFLWVPLYLWVQPKPTLQESQSMLAYTHCARVHLRHEFVLISGFLSHCELTGKTGNRFFTRSLVVCLNQRYTGDKIQKEPFLASSIKYQEERLHGDTISFSSNQTHISQASAYMVSKEV